MKLLRIVVILAVVALLLPGVLAQEDEEPIKIGFFAPLTGPAAADGEAAQRGAELAVKMINESGGVLGRPLELVVYDDAFSPDEAANVVRRMIEQDDVVGVVSGSYSFTTRAGAPIAQEAGVPFIGAYSVHPSITETGEYVWRIGALATVQGLAGAEIVHDELGAETVAVLTIDNDFGVSLTDAFKEHARELGMEIVFDERYPLGETDFRALLPAIEDSGADVLYASGYYGEAAALVSQMRDAGIDMQIVGQEGYDSPQFLNLAGEAANGVIFTTDLNRDSERESVQNFIEGFEEEYGEIADMVAGTSHDAVRVLAEAIRMAESTDADAIIDALGQIEDFEAAVTGPIVRFTEGREVVRPLGAQIVEDGEIHLFAELTDLELLTPPDAKDDEEEGADEEGTEEDTDE